MRGKAGLVEFVVADGALGGHFIFAKIVDIQRRFDMSRPDIRQKFVPMAIFGPRFAFFGVKAVGKADHGIWPR